MNYPRHQKKTGIGYEIRTCNPSCRHSLINPSNLEGVIEEIITDSGLSEVARKNPMGNLSHNRFKVSFSFCPNACTEPQIKDFGVIVRAFPEYCGGCTLCGVCEEVCQENAVHVDDQPRFDMSRCVGCGDCQKNCPVEAISVNSVYDIMIGGKLGRRPRFARHIARRESMEEVLNILKFILEFLFYRNKTRIGDSLDELINEFHKNS